MEKRNPLPPRVGIGAFFLRRVSSISEQDLLQYWEWCQDYKYVLTLLSLYRVFRRERSHLHGRGIKLSFIVPMSTQENTVIGGPELSLILVAANIKKGNFMNYVSLSVMVLPMSEPQTLSRRETVVQLECAVSESHVQEPLVLSDPVHQWWRPSLSVLFSCDRQRTFGSYSRSVVSPDNPILIAMVVFGFPFFISVVLLKYFHICSRM